MDMKDAAAPMPQANESEAVKALRKLVQAHDETDLSRFKTVGEHADYLNSLWDAARAVLAGEPGAKSEQPDYKAAAEQARAFGAPDMAAALAQAQSGKPKEFDADDMQQQWDAAFKQGMQAAQIAATPSRLVFPSALRKMWSGGEVQKWLDEQLGVEAPKPFAKGSLERYRAHQAAQTQAVGPTPKQESALQALADEAQALGLYDAQAQASGKAAPSDEDIIHIAARTVPAFTNRDALTFASALLERYGNSGSICAVEIKDGK